MNGRAMGDARRRTGVGLNLMACAHTVTRHGCCIWDTFREAVMDDILTVLTMIAILGVIVQAFAGGGDIG